jgi:hypothetical protein
MPGRISVRIRRTSHAQKHLLRQVLGGLLPSDDPAQIAKDSLPMQGEQRFRRG